MTSSELPHNIVFRQANISEIIELRRRVLIVGTIGHSEHFVGDDEPTTIHFGAFIGSDAVCCLSLMMNYYDGQHAYQLRGMATAPELVRKGIGSGLLSLAEQHVVSAGIHILWCNSQKRAEEFYRKQGWTTVSAEFDVAGVGPHVKMIKRI